MGTAEQARPTQQEDPYLPEKVLGLGEPIYTSLEVDERAGVDTEVAMRIWRAIGFSEPDEDEKAFGEADVESLRTLKGFIDGGLADIDLALGMTRIISQAAARVADAEASAIKEQLARNPKIADAVLEMAERSTGAAEPFVALENFLTHLWKRHLAEALRREDVLNPTTEEQELTIGFADIVGYTRMSRHIEVGELSRFIEAFETAAQDIAAEWGARVVKTIGDEVMFVADEPAAAALTALNLVERGSGDPAGIELRVGLATGPVLGHRGDYLGPTVNLASRAAQAAHPNSILVSQEMRDALKDREGLEIKPIPRRKLKGFGPTDLWVLRRRDPEARRRS